MLPILHVAPDDAMSTPWSTTPYHRLSSTITKNNSNNNYNYNDPLPRLSNVGMSISASSPSGININNNYNSNNNNNLTQLTESIFTAEDSTGEASAGFKEKSRRLFTLQRKKYKELIKAEDEAFKIILRQSESSITSILSFVSFREKIEASTERQRRLLTPWIQQSFADKFEQLYQEEKEKRQSIISYEWRLRESKRRIEWLTGAPMRYKRAMQMLIHAEECRRKFIEQSEMREARAIPVLKPFVLAIKHLKVIGQCPFVSVQDCPFYCRGEGFRSMHYEFSEKGKPEQTRG